MVEFNLLEFLVAVKYIGNESEKGNLISRDMFAEEKST